MAPLGVKSALNADRPPGGRCDFLNGDAGSVSRTRSWPFVAFSKETAKEKWNELLWLLLFQKKPVKVFSVMSQRALTEVFLPPSPFCRLPSMWKEHPTVSVSRKRKPAISYVSITVFCKIERSYSCS